GACVSGLDLREPLTQTKAETIRDALHAHGLLVFPGQSLGEAEQVAFSRHFGILDLHVTSDWNSKEHPEIYVISNIQIDGKNYGVPHGGFEWHSDFCYYEVPAMATTLYGVEVPSEGGETLFAHMADAYDALSDALKERIADLRGVFDYNAYRLRTPGRTPLDAATRALTTNAHPIVRRHPVTFRKALYVSTYVTHFEGMGVEESLALRDELMAHATAERFVYAHRWQAGDLVMWDNATVMHRASPYDQRYRRLMKRTVGRPFPEVLERFAAQGGA
ncbi:MAG: TauD/TfdA family dioxygenase, partial [Gammaproteobacteria bacterium]|nr:TauD/TfdA family dioxygenase [Gammaproteobacteria bacterium]